MDKIRIKTLADRLKTDAEALEWALNYIAYLEARQEEHEQHLKKMNDLLDKHL